MNIKRIIREEINGFKDSSEEDFDWAKDTPISGEGKFLDKFLDKPVSVTDVRFGDYCNNRTGYMGSFILRQEDGGFIVIYKEEDYDEVGIGFSDNENGIENFIGYDYRQDNEHTDCSQDEINVVKQVFPKTIGCKVI
jgi:hypothetical protein